MFLLPMGWVAQAAGAGAADAAAIALPGVAANLALATAGNLVGGALLVGVVYWFAYARK